MHQPGGRLTRAPRWPVECEFTRSPLVPSTMLLAHQPDQPSRCTRTPHSGVVVAGGSASHIVTLLQGPHGGRSALPAADGCRSVHPLTAGQTQVPVTPRRLPGLVMSRSAVRVGSSAPASRANPRPCVPPSGGGDPPSWGVAVNKVISVRTEAREMASDRHLGWKPGLRRSGLLREPSW